jgi:UDP-GalNAc:undecaprenyl-phosphate GalNAc-1-phosphate transferase
MQLKNRIIANVQKPAQESLGMNLFWTCLGWASIIFCSSWFAWGSPRFWETIPSPASGGLVFLCSMSYFVAAVINASVARYALVSRYSSVAWSVLLSFGAVFILLLLSRWYYSRPYLLLTFVLSLVWISLLARRQFMAQEKHFAVLPIGGAVTILKRLGLPFEVISTPQIKPSTYSMIVVDFHSELSTEWTRFLAEASVNDATILDAVTLFEAHTGRIPLESVGERALENFSHPRLFMTMKRLFDTTVVLLFSVPLLLLAGLVALAIRLETSGPVLFWQVRVGRGGHPFNMVKFRSMNTDAEKLGPQFAAHSDNRITQVGKLIRKIRLDEIPQFWNVLRGEMAIIGPRPEQAAFVEKFEDEIPYYAYRHLVRPGLTGWAQVNHGYAADSDETAIKLEHDLYYVKNISFWLDGVVVMKTISVVLSGFGSR